MSLRRKVFTSQKITLYFGGKEFSLQALVSVYGVKYAFDDLELPEEARPYIGYEVKMTYRNIPLRCRIVRETNVAGVFYNLRFVNPSDLFVRQIALDIEDSGLPSPWMRHLPRLSAEVPNLPSPALAVLEYRNETHYLNVKNFTLGGLLLELVGGNLVGVDSGTRIDFDLVTNEGTKLEGVAGMITHVSEETNESEGNANRSYFGLKFLPMAESVELKYRELIRQHCLLLRELETTNPNAVPPVEV